MGDGVKQEAALTSGQGANAHGLNLLGLDLQQAAWAGAQLAAVGLSERTQEEGHIVLPRNASEAGEVDVGGDVSISIRGVADVEFAEIGLVVHIPAKDD